MRISDWSSDVCSSDLTGTDAAVDQLAAQLDDEAAEDGGIDMGRDLDIAADAGLEARGELFQLRGAQRVRARDRGGRLAAVRGAGRVIGLDHRANNPQAAVLGKSEGHRVGEACVSTCDIMV